MGCHFITIPLFNSSKCKDKQHRNWYTDLIMEKRSMLNMLFQHAIAQKSEPPFSLWCWQHPTYEQDGTVTPVLELFFLFFSLSLSLRGCVPLSVLSPSWCESLIWEMINEQAYRRLPKELFRTPPDRTTDLLVNHQLLVASCCQCFSFNVFNVSFVHVGNHCSWRWWICSAFFINYC